MGDVLLSVFALYSEEGGLMIEGTPDALRQFARLFVGKTPRQTGQFRVPPELSPSPFPYEHLLITIEVIQDAGPVSIRVEGNHLKIHGSRFHLRAIARNILFLLRHPQVYYHRDHIHLEHIPIDDYYIAPDSELLVVSVEYADQ